jgi:hypothetical protein
VQYVFAAGEVGVLPAAFRTAAVPGLIEILQEIGILVLCRLGVAQRGELELEIIIRPVDGDLAGRFRCTAFLYGFAVLGEGNQRDGWDIWTGHDPGWVENGQAVDTAEIQIALGVPGIGVHVELIALQAVAGAVVAERLLERIEIRDPIVRT